MSPETFDRLASRTRMRERALAAARRYLVDGITNAAADGTDSGAIQQVVAAWNTRSELQPEEAPC